MKLDKKQMKKGENNEKSNTWKPWGCTHTHTHTHGLLEKSNNKINKIDLDNKITIKPKNIKT